MEKGFKFPQNLNNYKLGQKLWALLWKQNFSSRSIFISTFTCAYDFSYFKYFLLKELSGIAFKMQSVLALPNKSHAFHNYRTHHQAAASITKKSLKQKPPEIIDQCH